MHGTHRKTTQTRNATNRMLSKLHLHIIYISTEFLTLFLITYQLIISIFNNIVLSELKENYL